MKFGPDFIGIGATKAGTSWLYDRLNELDEFSMPIRKEIGYFDRFTQWTYIKSPLSEKHLLFRMRNLGWAYSAIINTFRRGLSNPAEIRFWWHWFFKQYNDNWYLNVFRRRDGFTGDITPAYMLLDRQDILKMKTLLPDARLIFLIRNPIERAWSQYRMMHNKVGSDKEIIEYMLREDQLLRSDYIRTINNYSSVYPKERILIGFYDAIIDQPLNMFKEIVQFITGEALKTDVKVDLFAHSNVSRKLTMPEGVKEFLIEYYAEYCELLADKFGGYCQYWVLKNNNEIDKIDKCKLPEPVYYLNRGSN